MKIQTAFFISLSLLFASSARADTYHRFWRGIMLPTLDPANFVEDLNRVFIPATIQTGAGKGLIGYEPVLTHGMKALPDEIALVSYQDLSTYNQLYSTDAGKAYQNLHWQYFDQSLSHSLAPNPYHGAVEIEQSYDFHPDYANWRENQTTVLVFYRKASEVDADFLDRAKQHFDAAFQEDSSRAIFDRTVLVAEQYWIEYMSALSPASATGADLVISLKSEDASDAKIVSGSGVNLQF